MPRDFIPPREADLVTWSLNFKTEITGAPLAFGLTALQATTYGGLHDGFVAQFNLAQNPSTRTPSAIIAKNTAKDALIAEARALAGIVQRHPGTTDEMRSDLGINVPAGRSPIGTPTVAPTLDVLSVTENTVELRLHDAENPTRRGKPDNIVGASIFSFVGAVPPTDAAGWKFEGNTSKTTTEVTFPGTTAPGAKVFFTAFWFTQKKLASPACAPVGTNIQGGSSMAA